MEKENFMGVLSEEIIRSMVTEDIEQFVKRIEKEEEIVDKILISPFIEKDLQPSSYDIHLGGEYISHMTMKKGKLKDGEELKIKPGETVTVMSLEYVGLPQHVMALITSRTHWIIEGLTQMSAYVDPGFYGRLFQTMTNLSGKEVKIKYKEPIAHLTFFKICGAKPNLRYRGMRLGQKSLSDKKQLNDIVTARVPNPFFLLRDQLMSAVLAGGGFFGGFLLLFAGIMTSNALYSVTGSLLVASMVAHVIEAVGRARRR